MFKICDTSSVVELSRILIECAEVVAESQTISDKFYIVDKWLGRENFR